jgi:hypothetical protein
MRPGSNPDLSRATSRLFTRSPGGGGELRTGFLVVSLHELHVYSSTGSKPEALSEYGVITV